MFFNEIVLIFSSNYFHKFQPEWKISNLTLSYLYIAGNFIYYYFLGKGNAQVVDLPIVDSLSPRPPWLPLAVPRDLAPRLSRIHGDPVVWWVGQFLRFLLRPQSTTYKMLEETSQKLGFQRPIVGSVLKKLQITN